METRLRLVIVDGGLPRPVAQFEVRDAAGRLIGRVDLAYPEWRIAIEYDGDHHRGRVAYRDDQRRANALRVAGWTVLRFTALGRLAQTGSNRCANPRSHPGLSP